MGRLEEVLTIAFCLFMNFAFVAPAFRRASVPNKCSPEGERYGAVA
jgi:hypothetical protein